MAPNAFDSVGKGPRYLGKSYLVIIFIFLPWVACLVLHLLVKNSNADSRTTEHDSLHEQSVHRQKTLPIAVKSSEQNTLFHYLAEY